MNRSASWMISHLRTEIISEKKTCLGLSVLTEYYLYKPLPKYTFQVS